MANVNVAAGVIELGVVRVLVSLGEDVHGVVGFMRIGVVRVEGHAFGDTAAQADLQRFVIGIDEIAESADLPEIPGELVGATEGRKIQFFSRVSRSGGTFHAAVAHVSGFKNRIF